MKTFEEIRAALGPPPAAATPAALLPVRLETRFVPQSPGGWELRVRVYPDDIHIDAFESGLTPEETLAGRRYWEGLWKAADTDDQQAAWRRLIERFDPPRAAWIARVLTPTNLDKLGRGTPAFPDHDSREESWTQPATVRLMPDRWVVLGYLDDQLRLLEIGREIPADLVVSPSPEQDRPPSPVPNDDELDIDDEMRWLVDFEEAERVGMALRISLDNETTSRGFDRLIVIGLQSENEAERAAERLAKLLHAQHYTDGLGFAPQGTPTNRSSDPEAPFEGRDPGHIASFWAETKEPLAAAGDGSNADVMAGALGIDASVFAHAPHAASRERDEARHMNRALWMASWGTYLRELVDMPFGSWDDYHDLREHFVDHVLARGPLPTLRIGRQPYGVLPIRVAGDDAAADRVTAVMSPLLEALRPRWQSRIHRIPRVGRAPTAAAAREDFLSALAMEGVSSRLDARPFLPREMFGIVGTPDFAPQYPPGVEARWQTAETIGEELGVGVRHNPLGTLIPLRRGFPMLAPFVQADLSADSLSPNYIAWLAEAPYSAIDAESFDGLGDVPISILYLILRYSTLVEYAYAAGGMRTQAGEFDPTFVSEPAFFGHYNPNQPIRPTRGKLADGQVEGLGDRPLREFIHTLDAGQHAEMAPVDAFRISLRQLAEVAPARLDRLLREGIDVCSYRLDAWITSLATRRLTALREKRPTGLVIGGYGWLEDVRRKPRTGVMAAPEGQGGGGVIIERDNAGFIQAPSMTHAATAAVLRSGFLSQPDEDGPLAVDLSSRRVRLAQALLDGVRNGQPLGALLGYRAERDLQDRGLAHLIAPLRRIAPMGDLLKAEKAWQEAEAKVEALRDSLGSGAGAANPELEAAEAAAAETKTTYEALVERYRKRFLFPDGADLAAMEAAGQFTVIDGLRLRRMWRAGALPHGDKGLPGAGDAELPGLEAALAELDDMVDAVADLTTAESVHQMVSGNPQRLGATLSTLAAGEIPPPEMEVTQTPRLGVAVEHRLLLLFSGPALSGASWPGRATRLRARAEPYIDGWATWVMGAAKETRIVGEYLDPAGESVVAVREIRLSELPLSASDMIYGARGGGPPESTTVGRWVLHHLDRTRPDGVPPDAPLRLAPGRRDGWRPRERSLAESLEVARAVHALITEARPLTPDDLTTPSGVDGARINAANLKARADAAQAGLRAARDALAAAVGGGNEEEIAGALLDLSFAGIDMAVPDVGGRDLDEQAETVLGEADQRLTRLNALAAGFNQRTATPAQRRDHATARMKTLFGQDFVALVRMNPADGAALEKAFAETKSLQGGDELAAHTWLRRAARVREPAERLERTLDYAEARMNLFGRPRNADLSVVQLPLNENDRWLGLPLEGREPEGGRISLVAHLPRPFKADAPVLGLAVDQWVDVLPARTQHAAVSFNFDAPGARPPQAILLAVPPEGLEIWDVEALASTVGEALDLAKMRAVGPSLLDDIDGFDQLLPALFFSLNLEGETISADFMRTASAPDAA